MAKIPGQRKPGQTGGGGRHGQAGNRGRSSDRGGRPHAGGGGGGNKGGICDLVAIALVLTAPVSLPLLALRTHWLRKNGRIS